MLVLGMISLVAGSLAGLARLALDVPALAQARADSHGALMIAAFFGTVISLERAVALRRGWSYLGPLCAGLGGLALLVGAPPWLGQSLFVAAGAVLTSASGLVLRQQPALFTFTLALGALSWLIGNAVWLLTASMAAAVPFWMSFLVLTIAGERLELTRFLPPRPAANRLFIGLLAIIGLGDVLSGWGVWGGDIGGDIAARLFGLGLLGLALRHLPLGTAYAVWTGVGTTGTALLGIFLFGEPADVARLVCITMIVAGIVGLKLVA